jgi:hypothetical protein
MKRLGQAGQRLDLEIQSSRPSAVVAGEHVGEARDAARRGAKMIAAGSRLVACARSETDPQSGAASLPCADTDTEPVTVAGSFHPFHDRPHETREQDPEAREGPGT